MAKIQVIKVASGSADFQSNRQEDGSTALVWVANAAHKYENKGTELLRIRKGSGAATLTIQTNAKGRFGLPLPDRTLTIEANSNKVYPPFSPGAHNERRDQDDEGYTSLKFSDINRLFVTIMRPTEPVA